MVLMGQKNLYTSIKMNVINIIKVIRKKFMEKEERNLNQNSINNFNIKKQKKNPEV